MPNSPLVTIGLPVYNSARYLERSLESLLAQTYRNFTLVISDNASTDGTYQICEQYAASDSRIKVFRNNENIGNPGNFNRVVEQTHTRYLKWSTGDDLWEPTFLEKAIEVMERDTSIALCYPKTYIVDAQGAIESEYEDNLHLMQDDPVERFLTLLENIGLAHQHLGVIRTSLIKRTHLLGPHLASDVNFLAELSLYGKLFELPERLFYRRFHVNSGSWDRGNTMHQARLYHPTHARRRAFDHWAWHLAFFGVVSTAPISIGSKAWLFQRLAKQMIWDRKELLREVSCLSRRPEWNSRDTMDT